MPSNLGCMAATLLSAQRGTLVWSLRARNLDKKWVSGALQEVGMGTDLDRILLREPPYHIPGYCPNVLGFPGSRAEGRDGLVSALHPKPLPSVSHVAEDVVPLPSQEASRAFRWCPKALSLPGGSDKAPQRPQEEGCLPMSRRRLCELQGSGVGQGTQEGGQPSRTQPHSSNTTRKIRGVEIIHPEATQLVGWVWVGEEYPSRHFQGQVLLSPENQVKTGAQGQTRSVSLKLRDLRAGQGLPRDLQQPRAGSLSSPSANWVLLAVTCT